MTLFRRIFPAMLSALLIAATPAVAQDKLSIATVDMQELFKQYYRTGEAQKQIDAERAKIQQDNNERLARIRTIEEQLETLGKQIEDSTIAEAKRKDLKVERQVKVQEGVALDRERREFLQRRNQALGEKYQQRMKSIVEEIRKLVEEQAKKRDYDYVFDKSGVGAAGVPFMLYTKDAADITAELLKVLNKDAPEGSLDKKDAPSE